MSSLSSVRIELLSRDNYDSWRIEVQALLVKNDVWCFVNGSRPRPSDPNESKDWDKSDEKAKAELILAISPGELRHTRGCATARDLWLKLESIYASKGPAKKATLLKQLTLKRMDEGSDIRVHMAEFFDAVDKLGDMGVDINGDLLSIILLYSLPASFENFRCAIETRDELPSVEILKIKIMEEQSSRRHMYMSTVHKYGDEGALMVKNKRQAVDVKVEEWL